MIEYYKLTEKGKERLGVINDPVFEIDFLSVKSEPIITRHCENGEGKEEEGKFYFHPRYIRLNDNYFTKIEKPN